MANYKVKVKLNGPSLVPVPITVDPRNIKVLWGAGPAGYAPAVHNHDDRYYTEAESDILLAGKSNNGHTHVIAEVTGLQGVLDSKELASNKGTLNGYPSLVNGIIPESQLPPIAITDTYPVASEVEMLALVAEKGDVAIRSDLNKSFILRQVPASALSNWLEVLSPTAPVQSVLGQTGAVNFNTDNIGEGSNNLYHTAARVRETILTGLSVATNAVILVTDTVLAALGKLQSQITSIINDGRWTDARNPKFIADFVAVTHTGTLDAATLKTYVVPAGTIKPGHKYTIVFAGTHNNSANVKRVDVFLNNIQIGYISQTTQSGFTGSATIQQISNNTILVNGSNVFAKLLTIDHSITDYTIRIEADLTATTDSIVLRCVERHQGEGV